MKTAVFIGIVLVSTLLVQSFGNAVPDPKNDVFGDLADHKRVTRRLGMYVYFLLIDLMQIILNVF